MTLRFLGALFSSYPYIRGPIKGTGQDGYPDGQKIETTLATFISEDVRAYLNFINSIYGGGTKNSTPLEERVFLCLRARTVDCGEQRLRPDAWYLYSLRTVDEALVTIEENWQLLVSRFNGLAVGFTETKNPTVGNCRVRFFSSDEICAKMAEES